MPSTVRIHLPFPVSVNALYHRCRGRVVLSERYRKWRREADLEIMRQKPGKVAGPVHVRIALVAPDLRKRDGDNLSKCVLDALVRGGVIEDDNSRTVLWSHPEWVEDGPPCVVTVTAVERRTA